MKAKAKAILASASNAALADAIVDSYLEVERNYALGSWKTSELDAGHFVEAVRRFIDLKLTGTFASIGRSLSPLNIKELTRLEQCSGAETYRIHIPRLLLSIYGIRNKRGVGHLSDISPNYMDATCVISVSKWVLAEIIRLESGTDVEATTRLVDMVVKHNTRGIWHDGEVTRILADGLSLREKILFLLFEKSPNTVEALRSIIEYTNKTYFRKTLKQLHSDRLLEMNANDECIISPKGISEAESIINAKVMPAI